MSSRPAKVTQAEIARVLRAVLQTGSRATIEICSDGMIRITAEKPGVVEPIPDPFPETVDDKMELVL